MINSSDLFGLSEFLDISNFVVLSGLHGNKEIDIKGLKSDKDGWYLELSNENSLFKNIGGISNPFADEDKYEKPRFIKSKKEFISTIIAIIKSVDFDADVAKLESLRDITDY